MEKNSNKHKYVDRMGQTGIDSDEHEREREWKEKSHPEITQLAKDVKKALIEKCMHAK